MNEEDKKLLLKDLCARLPYGTKAELHGEVCTVLGYFDDFVMLTSNTPLGQQTNIANIKLYLRSMSSMIRKEKQSYYKLMDNLHFTDGSFYSPDIKDWLDENHFDYRGLIEKGLALEAMEELYA